MCAASTEEEVEFGVSSFLKTFKFQKQDLSVVSSTPPASHRRSAPATVVKLAISRTRADETPN